MSNGSRLVSASAATQKMKKAIARPNAFQTVVACCQMMSLSATLPASNSTATVDMPSAISYDTI